MQVLTGGRKRRSSLRATFEIVAFFLACYVTAAAIIVGAGVVAYLVWLR